MNRRYANQVGREYTQKRIDEEYFKGYVCNVKIKDLLKISFYTFKNKEKEVKKWTI